MCPTSFVPSCPILWMKKLKFREVRGLFQLGSGGSDFESGLSKIPKPLFPVSTL